MIMPLSPRPLYRLLAAYGDGEVDLVTPTVTLKEIERYQGLQPPAIKRIFRLLKEVPIVVVTELWRRARNWWNS